MVWVGRVMCVIGREKKNHDDIACRVYFFCFKKLYDRTILRIGVVCGV